MGSPVPYSSFETICPTVSRPRSFSRAPLYLTCLRSGVEVGFEKIAVFGIRARGFPTVKSDRPTTTNFSRRF